MSKANRIKDAIKRAYEYRMKNPTVQDPGVRVESEDLEMAKRLTYRDKGIQLVGRL